jgi:hypothetical protein
MNSAPERQMAKELADEATAAGARQSRACEEIGISVRSYLRRQANGLEDRRQCVEKQPGNKLSEQECQGLIDICNQKAYRSLSAKEIVPKLVDRNIYLASESTFYRILREENMMHHLVCSKAPSNARTDSQNDTSSNQLWPWDVTYLSRSVRGLFFSLYLFMDIYSRKIVGWEIYKMNH